MVSEHQKYMTFELMFMCFGESESFLPFEPAIPISLQKSLILVSRDMAGIVRPYLFRSVSLYIKPISPSHLDLPFSARSMVQFRSAPFSNDDWPHAVYIRYLNLFVDAHCPNNWRVAYPQPYPTERAASAIYACKSLRGLQLCIYNHTSANTSGPGILPILEAMSSIPTLRVFRQVTLIGGERSQEARESNTVGGLGAGLTELSLDLRNGPYEPDRPGHQCPGFFGHVAHGAAPTLRRLHLHTATPPNGWSRSSPISWSAVDTVLREGKFPVLDYLRIRGNHSSLDQFLQFHPQLKELRLKGNDPPDLTTLSALSEFHYTSDYHSTGTDLDEADVAKALLTLKNPGKLKKLVASITSFASGLPFLHQTLRCLRMVSLEELEVNANLCGTMTQQPIGRVRHDFFTLLQEMPRLRTVHFGGPIALFKGLPPIPTALKGVHEGLRAAYVTSLNTWAEGVRPQLVNRIVRLASDAHALEHFHWEPICREIVDNTIDFDQHKISAEHMIYWNVHTDFIIHRGKGGIVKRVDGGFHRLAPKDNEDYDFEQYSAFPTFPRQYAVPWRVEDMESAQRA